MRLANSFFRRSIPYLSNQTNQGGMSLPSVWSITSLVVSYLGISISYKAGVSSKMCSKDVSVVWVFSEAINERVAKAGFQFRGILLLSVKQFQAMSSTTKELLSSRGKLMP